MKANTVKMIGGYVGGALCFAVVVFQKKLGFELGEEMQIALLVGGMTTFGIGTHGALKTPTDEK